MYATQQLRDEHEGILTVLAVLEQMAEDAAAGRAVNLEHAGQVLDFLRTFADKCHHGKEEEHLFPALEAAGFPRNGGPTAVMRMEHDEGRRYIQGMGEALARMRAGQGGEHEFAADARGYVHLLRAHIDKENLVLFTMAEQALPPQEHERLAREFDRVEAERIGPGVHEQYHALIDTLRDTYLKVAA
ncbi:MAG: hemerythrin [Armatimonadetes bacterium]|jgi:hemerythrin-like domain-containing protein|nr:hemerythrin [Armatimonadota bacterium]